MSRQHILEILARYQQDRQDQLGILRLGVFGSAARDFLRDDSDIDVVVELAKPDLFTLVGIQQELAELLHRRVDLVRYREKMNAFLKRRIDNEAVYV